MHIQPHWILTIYLISENTSVSGDGNLGGTTYHVPSRLGVNRRSHVSWLHVHYHRTFLAHGELLHNFMEAPSMGR